MKNLKYARVFLSVFALTAFPAFTLAAPNNSEKLVQDSPDQKSAIADLQMAQEQLMPFLDQGKVFGDAAKRAEVAPKALPLLHEMIAAFDTLKTHVVRTNRGVEYKFQTLAMIAVFGDAKDTAQLKADAASKDDAVAIEATVALALSDWWKAAHDEAAQMKVLQSIKELAHDHPKDDQITVSLLMMDNMAPASPALHDSAMQIIADELKGPLAQRVGMNLEAEHKLKALENKPLVIAGLALDGKTLTTADWKGKVILVDFWASWCGPCKAELPRVKKAYADYHAKGLEVLGVSCDRGAGPLHAFLDQNPDMPWPQLFDPSKPGWHEIAKGFGINGIPTMFLIDKAGVVRSVTARENFEELIPKMLEEK